MKMIETNKFTKLNESKEIVFCTQFAFISVERRLSLIKRWFYYCRCRQIATTNNASSNCSMKFSVSCANEPDDFAFFHNSFIFHFQAQLTLFLRSLWHSIILKITRTLEFHNWCTNRHRWTFAFVSSWAISCDQSLLFLFRN